MFPFWNDGAPNAVGAVSDDLLAIVIVLIGVGRSLPGRSA
jgi:hypothetical protein